jgi:hypothetical protein
MDALADTATRMPGFAFSSERGAQLLKEARSDQDLIPAKRTDNFHDIHAKEDASNSQSTA